MQPILANRTRTVLYLLAWIPLAVLLTTIFARGGAMPWGEAATLLLPMCLVYAFVCQASWYLCVAIPLRPDAVARLITTHTAAAALSAGVWFGTGWIVAWLLDSTLAVHGIADRFLAQTPMFLVSGFLIFLLAVTFNYLLITFEASQQAENRALELQVLAREAELKALRAQIDPHFLFNSLNSISALVMTDPASARKMCVLLAEFLRGSLKFGAENRICLADEMRLAECYLDIERVRLGRRLQVERSVDPQCEGCLVPPLIIQPLVENAITHGVAPALEGGVVRVRAERNRSGVKIVIENAFELAASTSNGTGMGLKNVKLRLSNLYRDEARMDVRQDDGWFRVELQMPCTH